MQASLLDAVPTNAAMAMGFRQQWLVVSPDENLVLVRLGHNWPVDRRGHFYRNVTTALFGEPA